MSSRICYYYQTFNGLQCLLEKPQLVDIIIVSSIHFGINKDGFPYIHLNDEVPDNKIFNQLWAETQLLSHKGVKIMIMMGGAGGAYNHLFSNYSLYYPMLVDTIRKYNWITGIDLDIEEYVNVDDVKILINNLKKDFGEDFTITMAPVQSALMDDNPGLGGFTYKDLYNSPEGQSISHFNVQCYSSYTLDAIKKIVENGYPSDKIVMGMLGGDYSPSEWKITLQEVEAVKSEYNDIGGVFCWEYCISPPDLSDPSKWAEEMANIIKPKIFRYYFLLGKYYMKTFIDKISYQSPYGLFN